MKLDRKPSKASKKLNPVSRSLLSSIVFLGRKIVPERNTNIQLGQKVFSKGLARQPNLSENKELQGVEAPIPKIPSEPTLDLPPEPAKEISAISQKNKPTLAREHTRQTLAEAGVMKEMEDNVSDVFLDIPTVKVDEIKLNVEDLDAKVALHAQLANLVRIDVGAEVGISKVELDIKGVEAQALLKVRLKQVYAILARALETLDRNPELINSLLQPVGEAVETLGKETGRAVGEIGARTGQAIGPGGAIGDTIRNVGETTKETLGPQGLINQTAKDVGKTLNHTTAPEGAVGHTLSNVDQTVKGVAAPQGPVSEAIQGVSEGVDHTIEGQFHEDEEKRRYYQEAGKRHIREPDVKRKKPA